MKPSLDRQGGLQFVRDGRTLSRNTYPLEMEMEGLVYRGIISQGPGGTFQGTLSDGRGPFLSLKVKFKIRRSGELEVLEEERRYQALRDLPRTLLTLRYLLEPVTDPGDGFLVIPALWYGDNEAWQDRIVYPKGFDQDWSFRADGSSCPAVVWTTPKASYSVGIPDSVPFPVADPGNDDVLGIGFARIGSAPQALFTFPAQEVPKSYPRARKLRSPKIPRVDWRKGQVLTMTLTHMAGRSDRAFHTKVWRASHERALRASRYRGSEKDWRRTADLFTHCLKESHFLPGKGFSHRHDIPEIFTGWCGGFAAAYAALRWADLSGDPEFRRMGETMCDYITREGLSPSGIFYSENVKGVWLQKVFWGTADGLHMRNPAEGSCYLALILGYERARGRFRPEWERALRSNLDAVSKLQRKDGAIPHEVDGRTGRPLSWTGATSGTWVGALAVLSRIDEDRKRAKAYLRTAVRAARYYLKEYVEKERYIGGPYDTYMAPNMEDPYNLLLAFSELHTTTGKREWLMAAKRVADHLLSWRYTYDVRFPEGTICRRQRVRTFHMSPASVSNKHIQNWDTLAAPYLMGLSRSLGDPFYGECALQHLSASTQLVQRGQLPKGIPYGGQSEQWYATDFNWFGNCGRYSKGNLWQITVALPKAGFLIGLSEWMGKKR